MSSAAYRNCRKCENYIVAKKGKRKALLKGTLSGALRDVKMAPNTATSLPPAVEFLKFERWCSDVPVYSSRSKKNTKTGVGERAETESPVGNLRGMWGSKWRVKWSVPVDVDFKIDYEGRLSTSLATDGSLYLSMRNLVVEGQPWIFIDATCDLSLIHI